MTAEETAEERFARYSRAYSARELAGMLIELERSLELGRKRRARRRIPRAVYDVLASCFRAAAAGGFSGDTDDITPEAAEATRRWLANQA